VPDLAKGLSFAFASLLHRRLIINIQTSPFIRTSLRASIATPSIGRLSRDIPDNDFTAGISAADQQ